MSAKITRPINTPSEAKKIAQEMAEDAAAYSAEKKNIL